MSLYKRQEKLATVYETEIEPNWSNKFGDLILRRLQLSDSRTMLLEVACRAGQLSYDIIKKHPEHTRNIARDPSITFLNLARKKVGSFSGSKIFFRTEDPAQGLSFADEVYDATFCNLAITDLPDPMLALSEFARVTRSGGQVLYTLPVKGTWMEFFDIFREVLTKIDEYDILAKVDEYEKNNIPTVEEAKTWAENVGLKDVTVETEHFELLFKSAREFFYSPIIEFGPLEDWKNLIENKHLLKKIFKDIETSIDTLFKGMIFPVTVEAACISGIKQEEDFEEIELDDDDLEITVEEDE